MSKRTNTYNRQTPKYKQNVFKGELKKTGVKEPKWRNEKLIKKWAIRLSALWIILVICTLFFSVKAALIELLIAIAAAAGLLIYYDVTDKEYIRAYMQLGVEKKAYQDALLERGVNPKHVARIGKLWSKVEKQEARKREV